MPKIKQNVTGQETRRRLIEAAGEVFAEHGLHGATIKEITDRAGANMASINYHFRDKFELHAEVVRYILQHLDTIPPADQLTGSPEDRLRAFIAYVLRDLSDPARPRWHVAVLTNEIVQPTTVLDAVLDDLIKPRADFLHGLIRDILGDEATEEKIAYGTFSVAAQCFHYLYNAELIRRIQPTLVHEGDSDKLAAHIAEFSLAGLAALRAKSPTRHAAP